MSMGNRHCFLINHLKRIIKNFLGKLKDEGETFGLVLDFGSVQRPY